MSSCFLIGRHSSMVLRRSEWRVFGREMVESDASQIFASRFYCLLRFIYFFVQIIIESHFARSRSSAPVCHKCGNSAIHNTFNGFEYIFFYALSSRMVSVCVMSRVLYHFISRHESPIDGNMYDVPAQNI